MKKLLTIIIAAGTLLFFANSCKKTGGSINPLADVKNLGVGSYLVLDSTINLNFESAQINTSTVGILVTEYPNGEPVDHIIIYAVKGSNYDTTTWSMIKTVPYAGKGTKLAVTGAELGTALGVDPSTFTAGSFYSFYTRVVTKSGKSYDVSNTGNNAGSGLVTGPYYYSAFVFTAYMTCPFTGGMAGNYTVVADDWADWKEGDAVQVTDGPGPNQINLSKIYPAGGIIGQPLVVNVAPSNGVASIPKVTFGSYSAGGTQYSAEGANANDVAGYVFSCTGYITLTMDIQGGGTDYGPNRLILQKQ